MATNVKVDKMGRVSITTEDGQTFHFETSNVSQDTSSSRNNISGGDINVENNLQGVLGCSDAIAASGMVFSSCQAVSNAVLASAQSLADTFIQMQVTTAKASDMLLSGGSLENITNKDSLKTNVYG